MNRSRVSDRPSKSCGLAALGMGGGGAGAGAGGGAWSCASCCCRVVICACSAANSCAVGPDIGGGVGGRGGAEECGLEGPGTLGPVRGEVEGKRGEEEPKGREGGGTRGGMVAKRRRLFSCQRQRDPRSFTSQDRRIERPVFAEGTKGDLIRVKTRKII